jgi:hypothetical protein
MCQGERCTNPVPCGRCERGQAEPPARDEARAELLQLTSRERLEIRAAVRTHVEAGHRGQ